MSNAKESGEVKLKRHDDWPTELAGFLEKAGKDKVHWTSSGAFVWDAVRAITGVNLGRRYRGNAQEIFERTASKHGLEEVPILFARRGDVVLFENETGQTLGIVGMDGKHIVSVRPGGLVFCSVRQGLKAWRV